VGSTITFRYQELSDRGVPRFPSFVRVCREEAAAALAPANPTEQFILNTETSHMLRHFEFIEGNSSKFWEVSVDGPEVTVRFGRIGTQGQTQTKPLPDSQSAARHAEKLIAEKLKKGYVESGL
jgi:DNA ligase-1